MNFLLVKLNHHCQSWLSIDPCARHVVYSHLARGITICVYPVQQSVGQLLSHLADVLSQDLCFLSIPRRLEGLVEREGSVARNGKVCVKSEVHDGLLGVSPGHLRFDLLNDFAYEQDAVYEDAIGGTFDFKIAEEGVGAEQGQSLVQRVVAFV